MIVWRTPSSAPTRIGNVPNNSVPTLALATKRRNGVNPGSRVATARPRVAS